MNQSINYYELKTQLADLGFVEDSVSSRLRNLVLESESGLPDIELTMPVGELQAYFTLFFGRGTQGGYELTCIDCSMDNLTKPGCQYMQYFQPDVPALDAIALLQIDQRLSNQDRDPFMPLNLQETKQYIHELNLKSMNTQNLAYLQKQLLNLGFGESLNQELENHIAAKTPEFILNTTNTYNKQKVDYALHYKAGEQNEMYFFNKYDAQSVDKKHTFYLNQGQGITAKEAFNLLEGRAVYKHLENLERQPYNAWLVLDQKEHKLKPYTDGWNYKPERAIDKMNIVGIDEVEARDKLMASLQKGNRHQVTAIKNGKEVQLFIEANPAEHLVKLTNYKGENQRLDDYKKPEFKADQKQDQKQTQKETVTDDGVKKKRKSNKKIKVG